MTNQSYIAPPSFGYDLYMSSEKVSGIYVCWQQQPLPVFSPFLDYEYKIGVSDDIINRIENAKNDSAFLFEEVKLVEYFRFPSANLKLVEEKLHNCLQAARLNKQIGDHRPQEWFFVSLKIIRETVAKIRDGTIENYQYNTTIRHLH